MGGGERCDRGAEGETRQDRDRDAEDDQRREGRTEGGIATLRTAIGVVYEARFGALPARLRAALETATDVELLTRWAAAAATQTPEQLARTILGSTAS